jgi:hypothetical protein
MTLLAEWGKLYQVTSKVGGYGVITDEAELSRTRTATLPCHVQYFIYVYGYSLLLSASPSLLCMTATAKVTQYCTTPAIKVVRPAGQQATLKQEDKLDIQLVDRRQ